MKKKAKFKMRSSKTSQDNVSNMPLLSHRKDNNKTNV